MESEATNLAEAVFDMYRVIKRDGKISDFDITKISGAIAKAFEALGKPFDPNTIDFLALKVTAEFEPKVKDELIGVEAVQDSVEETLIQAGYADVAKAYILYRKEREKMRQLKSTILDYKATVNNYMDEKNWRMRENSTVSYSVGGLILSNSGAITANYWLSEIYDEEITAAHRSAELHLHDLTMLTGYCAGWSLRQLIAEGLGGVMGKIDSKPPKHLYSLCNQMINFLGVMQNEWAGAQSFASFDTCLAPFVKADGLSFYNVKNCIETFVFGVNTPSRWGTQAPFSNIFMDWTVPEDLRDQHPIIGGKPASFTYGDCQPEMDVINRAFIEVMMEGDANGSGLLYPIPTYAITPDFNWADTENNRLLFTMAAKHGTPYFANCVSIGMKQTDLRKMLRPVDRSRLICKAGGFFGCGESTGSIGAVTLNLPRLAYLSADEEDFMRRLDKLMDIAARSLTVKRGIISKLMNEGMYPYTRRYIGSFENHFSTIGIVGMNEAALNACWLRCGLSDVRARRFARDVLEHIRARLLVYQQKTGDLYNLEATPAESTAFRMAREDARRYPDIITAARPGGTPYYTNSSQLPVDFTDDVLEALDAQDEFQAMYTGGTVFHVFTDRALPSWGTAAALARRITQGYRLPYFTITPTYSVCAEHGYLEGEQAVCPLCGKRTEVMSRITGYYRPLDHWNEGKLEEYRARKTYKI